MILAATARWRAMRSADLETVHALSERLHSDYPERAEIFAEKLRLFPRGCFVLESSSGIVGYCISHPWSDGMPPRLDVFFGTIPSSPETYFVHDLAVDQAFRGQGFAREVLVAVAEIARAEGIGSLRLVSVNGTERFWTKNGFRSIDDAEMRSLVQSTYGRQAVMMEAFPVS